MVLAGELRAVGHDESWELLLAQGRDGEAASLLGPSCHDSEQVGDDEALRRARALLRRLA